MKASIVIPAYNEESGIGKVLDEIKALVKSQKLDADIIVVNDGSTDKTAEIAKK